MIKLTDLLAKKLKEVGVDNVYGLTGGAVVHIFDSFKKNNVNVTFTNHEQAAAFAATGHSKFTNSYSCCVSTTGPGVTNTLTGLAGAWLDSCPVVFISGQARYNQTTNDLKNIRQIGTQQLNIIPIVESMTKYSVMLKKADDIVYELEKALFIAKHERPGPVWIDIPIDFQWSMINEDEIKTFYNSEEYISLLESSKKKQELNLDLKFENILEMINNSKFPLFLIGNGIRLSNSVENLKLILEKLNIPFVTTWLASDIFSYDHKQNIGRVGLAGQRGANIAIQNSDLLFILGTHLPIPVTGSNVSLFSRDSKKIIVNIDEDELNLKNDQLDLCFNLDLKEFTNQFIKKFEFEKLSFNIDKWLDHCEKLKIYNYQNTLDLVKTNNGEKINQYEFVNYFSENIGENDSLVVDGGGTNVYISYQGFKNKKNQRQILSTGLCSMGSGIPEAIGVVNANKTGSVYCFVGDGSFYLNVQELKTLTENNIHLKIVVFNNGGYLSIKETQREFLDSNFIGVSNSDPVNMKLLVEAFGLNYYSIKKSSELEDNFEKFLNQKKSSLLEVFIDDKQKVIPTQYFKKIQDKFEVQPLENMAPPLEKKLFNSLIINKNIIK